VEIAGVWAEWYSSVDTGTSAAANCVKTCEFFLKDGGGFREAFRIASAVCHELFSFALSFLDGRLFQCVDTVGDVTQNTD
jgi:hypothetical protein